MADEPIDLEKERNKRLPNQPFIELPDDDESYMNLVELFTPDGARVQGRVGLTFELCTCGGQEPIPALALTPKQCRALGNALVQVAGELEARDGQT